MQQQWSELETDLLTRARPVLGHTLSDKKVMILEDDLCLKTMLVRLFHVIDPEIEVLWMDTGEQAIGELNTHLRQGGAPFQLIVADISTPGNKSGLDFWQLCQLRFPKVPFLFISSMPVDRFLRILGQNVLCPPFLPKPFKVGECRQIVEGLLKYAEDEHGRKSSR